ncbi:MAG: hypothetical protein AAGB19_22370 [Cyanobacteria bacterium P01_F01_bin.3]
MFLFGRFYFEVDMLLDLPCSLSTLIWEGAKYLASLIVLLVQPMVVGSALIDYQ